MYTNWIRLALVNFLLAGLLGLLMRYAFVGDVPWINYRFIMHAHSHVAMLGWLYLALYALIVHSFSLAHFRPQFYKRLFWATQISVIGMFVTFPLQGYASWSIVFSTMHIFLSFIFVRGVFTDLNKTKDKRSHSTRFLRTSLLLMVLSTLALLAMPVIMLTGGRQSALYYGAVQFFLHFQFNGFYIFGVLALIFKWMDEKQVNFSPGRINLFYFLLLTSCLLTYVLAVTWSTPIPLLFWINSLGVLIQLGALVVFIQLIRTRLTDIKRQINGWIKSLAGIALISFCLKIVVQGAVVIPYIAVVAYTIRIYVIGFIHLLLLGMITAFILALALDKGWLSIHSVRLKAGIILLFMGILLTEFILFLQGTLLWAAMGFLPYYYEILFGASIFIPTGVVIIFLDSCLSNKSRLSQV